MARKAKRGWMGGMIGALVIALCAGLLAATGSASGEEPRWVWTKQTPKPDWWPFDHLKEKPVRGGYIRAAAGRYIGLFNPNHWPINDWVTMTYLYGGLVYIDGHYQPTFLWLAESYTYTNPTTCIMKLRPGIRFHDGTPFNAESVKYLMDWIKDKRNGAWTRSWIEPVKSVEVVDELTVKWHFKRPWAGFLGMMATTPGYMISKKALEADRAIADSKLLARRLDKARKKVARLEKKAAEAASAGGEKAEKSRAMAERARKKAEAMETQLAAARAKAEGAKSLDVYPVGTGRYMYEDASPGNYIKLKRNPDWWFGRAIGWPDLPYPDGYYVTIIPDTSVQLANLRAGKIDSMLISPSLLDKIKKDPNLNVSSMVGNHLYALRFNLAKGPCKDIRVRKAVSHALDRKALIHGTMFGQAIAASCMYHTTHWCHNPNLKPVRYDPELSRKLLAEAGYAKGLKLTGYFSNLPDFATIAEAVKNMLAQVGIDWQVELLEPVASSDRMKNLQYDLAQGGWAYIKEPDMMATGLYHPDGGFNYGRSHNERAIALIEAGKKELDMKKRQKIYWELEKVLYDNYEDAWLWYPIINVARRKALMGYDVELHKKGGEGYWFTHPAWLKGGHR